MQKYYSFWNLQGVKREKLFYKLQQTDIRLPRRRNHPTEILEIFSTFFLKNHQIGCN
jgi:DNA-binding NtrC family response regulator